MTMTFHTVGSQEYKVEHEGKKIYRKQAIEGPHAPVELMSHPEGYKWIETGGDYDRFVARYSALVSPEPVLNVEPLPALYTPAPLAEDSESQAEELPDPSEVIDFKASAETAKKLATRKK